MRLARRIHIICAVATALVLAGSAAADIKAFNAAVKAGDYKTAAAEAKTIWPGWDKAHQDTAVLAREFGFASYVAGDYAAAQSYGQFLKDQGASLTVPDDQPATSRVLHAAASFRLKADDGTRAALYESLKAREASAGIDNMTALASEALYKSDWASTAWDKATESGELAQLLLERGGIQLAPRALEARAAAATAHFMRSPDKNDYDRLVDTHDAVVDAIDAALDPRKRMALVPLKFQLEAWSTSVMNYFRSAQQTGTNVPTRVRERDLKKPADALFPDSVTTGDQCKKPDVNWPSINYPQAAGFAGMVGTVIMRVDTDAEGRIIKSETLAAVPSRHFADTVEEGISEMSYKRSKEDAAGCTLAATSRVVYFTFRIG